MKREDLTLLVAVVIVAATFSFVVSSSLIKYNQKSNTVPVVEVISPNLPDPYNDPAYKSIFNESAIDAAQLTQIGNNKNNSPFRDKQ